MAVFNTNANVFNSSVLLGSRTLDPSYIDGGIPPIIIWILETGIWNDDGRWLDTATWID